MPVLVIEKPAALQSVRAWQSPHGELDFITLQLPPALYLGPVGSLWPGVEPLLGLLPGMDAIETESFTHEQAVASLRLAAAMPGNLSPQTFERRSCGNFRHASSPFASRAFRD